jgi:hypothetical protein
MNMSGKNGPRVVAGACPHPTFPASGRGGFVPCGIGVEYLAGNAA